MTATLTHTHHGRTEYEESPAGSRRKKYDHTVRVQKGGETPLKVAGNAIVPQVAEQIMKAIKSLKKPQ